MREFNKIFGHEEQGYFSGIQIVLTNIKMYLVQNLDGLKPSLIGAKIKKMKVILGSELDEVVEWKEGRIILDKITYYDIRGLEMTPCDQEKILKDIEDIKLL